MFDTNQVASRIKEARMKQNMTQMNLADEMGVSYQAVSNWERGNSMPDISKLSELCRILDTRLEELVGEKKTETEIAERLIQDGNAGVTLEEMAQIGALVSPEAIKSKAKETREASGSISFDALMGLAPFLDPDTLGDMIGIVTEEMDFEKLCAIAPFLTREMVDKAAETIVPNGKTDVGEITALAPFLSRDGLQKLVLRFGK